MAAEEGPDLPETRGDGKSRRTRTSRKPARVRTGLGARLVVLAIAFVLVALGFELAGKPIQLPVVVVAEIENRLNATMAEVLPETTLSVGGIEVVVGADWVPHLRLDDVQLARIDGPVLATLPETELTLNPEALLSGEIRARSIRVSGATVAVRRDAQGRFDFSFGSGQGPKIDGLGALFALLDRTFAAPSLSGFSQIEADALSLTFADAISGRTWALGDGHFVFENRRRDLAAALSLSLIGKGGVAAEVDMTAISEKGRGTGRITATVHHVAASDLAAQTPVLGFLATLDAPISGQIVVAVDTRGIEGMEGRLDIGAGAFQPADQARPLAFDRASLSIRYSPEDGRIQLGEVSVESSSLRVKAQGQAFLVDAAGHVLTGPLDGRQPAAFLGQVSFDKVLIDPEGIFDAPISFSQGAIEMRLALNPFTLTLGQFSLAEGDQRLVLKGKVTALADGRLNTALDISVNQMSRDRLLALWPPRLVAPTRGWIVENISTGMLTDIHAALREVTGAAPTFELDYAFHDAAFRFLKEMPPVEKADGYSTIQGQVYTLVMNRGTVQAPQGGTLDMSGSVMRIADIFEKTRGDGRVPHPCPRLADRDAVDPRPAAVRIHHQGGAVGDAGHGAVRHSGASQRAAERPRPARRGDLRCPCHDHRLQFGPDRQRQAGDIAEAECHGDTQGDDHLRAGQGGGGAGLGALLPGFRPRCRLAQRHRHGRAGAGGGQGIQDRSAAGVGDGAGGGHLRHQPAQRRAGGPEAELEPGGA